MNELEAQRAMRPVTQRLQIHARLSFRSRWQPSRSHLPPPGHAMALQVGLWIAVHVLSVTHD